MSSKALVTLEIIFNLQPQFSIGMQRTPCAAGLELAE